MDRTRVFFSQYCITVGFVCLLLYMYGFFPIKKSTDIFASENDFPLTLQEIKFHKEKLYSSSVGKTVLMVIDGIRVDFVTADNMPYTVALLENGGGDACQLTARVTAPTVTLPRIKAIVTGTVSNYIDVVLNFGTKELLSDSIIRQAARSKRVVFYGDDTWTKLFPRLFTRSDGTSSFFVNDHTEVDNNVTRHLDGELQRSDWGLMVLHYLGLDHIGHIAGPKSPLIKPKLREMDAIIERLHRHLQKQGGVLVVCGDHGMKDSGSHGGVSLPEVLVPVIVLGLSCPHHFKEEILQVDLASTLSVLWGAPIPADNMGVVVTALLGHLSPAQRNYVLLYNTQQLADNFLRNGGSMSHESYRAYGEARRLHYEWLTNSSSVSHHQVSAQYQVSLLSMSRHLSQVLANYHMPALYTAMAILLQLVCSLGLSVAGASPGLLSARWTLSLVAVALMGVFSSSLAASLSLLLIFIFNCLLIFHQLKVVFSVIKSGALPDTVTWHCLLPGGSLLFCVSLFSSSLIEEEHQLWYFLWASVVCLRIRETPFRWFCVLVAHRLLRSLNQTGDRWAHLADLSDWLSQPENQVLLSITCALSLVLLCWCCSQLFRHRLSVPLYVCVAGCIYLHKSGVKQVIGPTQSTPTSHGGVVEARVCGLLVSLVLLLGRSLDCLLVCWMLLSCLLLRSFNTLLVPALFLSSRAVTLSHAPAWVNTILHHWLGAVFFFYQGNSNSLASVDVAAGYVGLEHYNAAVVVALLIIHTYSAPVLAYLLNLHSIINRTRFWRREVTKSLELISLLQLLHVFFCLVVITLQRYHLFVWSVFSPKLLYVGAQTFVYFILVTATNICTVLFMKKQDL